MSDVFTPQEFPEPLAVFAKRLKGTTDEVYVKLLQIRHGDRPRLSSEWAARLETLRTLPAH